MVGGLVSLIITLLVVGILVALVFYVADAIPLPDPIGRIVKVTTVVIAALAIVMVLLRMVGVDVPLPT